MSEGTGKGGGDSQTKAEVKSEGTGDFGDGNRSKDTGDRDGDSQTKAEDESEGTGNFGEGTGDLSEDISEGGGNAQTKAKDKSKGTGNFSDGDRSGGTGDSDSQTKAKDKSKGTGDFGEGTGDWGFLYLHTGVRYWEETRLDAVLVVGGLLGPRCDVRRAVHDEGGERPGHAARERHGALAEQAGEGAVVAREAEQHIEQLQVGGQRELDGLEVHELHNRS